jgi:copper chaperone
MAEIAELNVLGMKCGGCENSLKTKLSELPGVISVNASHQDKKVVVEYDPERVNLEQIGEIIDAAGFSLA